MEKGHQYDMNYEINYFDADKNKELKIHNLIDICNNASSLHSEAYDVGIDYLKDNSFTWVFLKSSINLNKIPKYKDKIKINTYSVGAKRFFASRYFEIIDETENEIGIIKGLYCLIDTKTRKPVPIPEGLMDRYGTSNSYVALKDLKLKPPAKKDWEKKFEVRYYDIDTNGHVNNSVYPMWCLETLPISFHEEKQLISMDIIFEKEVFYGHEVKIISQIEDDNTILQGIYNSNNEVTTLIKTIKKEKTN